MSSIEVVKTLGVSTNGQVPSATPEVYFDGTQTISANAYSVPIYVAHQRGREPGRAGRWLTADLRERVKTCPSAYQSGEARLLAAAAAE